MNSQRASTSDAPPTALTTPSLLHFSSLLISDILTSVSTFNNFSFSKIPLGFSNLGALTYQNISNAMFKDSVTIHLSNLTSLVELDLSCSWIILDYSSVYSFFIIYMDNSFRFI
ncbi:hypothetical protein V6N13_054228 [Hibiscus sabdariffa]|uniref:Uncharacterized protein n=2 Tax=Hibiscus sabdariffa TaxID=183260 RepID=A0ABR2DZ02_9ROSI